MLINANSSQCQGVVAAGWSLNGRWAVQIANALQMAAIAGSRIAITVRERTTGGPLAHPTEPVQPEASLLLALPTGLPQDGSLKWLVYPGI